MKFTAARRLRRHSVWAGLALELLGADCALSLRPAPEEIDEVDGGAPDRLRDASPDSSRGTFVDANADADADAETGAVFRCDPNRTWTDRSPVASVPSEGFGRFSGVSADGLTIAWTGSTSGAEGGSNTTAYVATRSDLDDSFGPAIALPVGSASLADDRAALSATGAMVIAVTSDRTAFVAFTRANTDTGPVWSPLSPLQFVNVRAMIGDGGGEFSEPVLGADGLSLYYLLTYAGAVPLLEESTWDAEQLAWTTGAALPNAEFASTATGRRRPTGASADGATLFYYDELAGRERAAWRAGSGAFAAFSDLTDLAEAAPNARCDQIFFHSADLGGAVIATAQ